MSHEHAYPSPEALGLFATDRMHRIIQMIWYGRNAFVYGDRYESTSAAQALLKQRHMSVCTLELRPGLTVEGLLGLTRIKNEGGSYNASVWKELEMYFIVNNFDGFVREAGKNFRDSNVLRIFEILDLAIQNSRGTMIVLRGRNLGDTNKIARKIEPLRQLLKNFSAVMDIEAE